MEQSADELMKRPYARVLVPDETGGYVAEVLELSGCVSEGDTPDEAIDNLDDAMLGWLKVAIEDGTHIPEPLESANYNGRILLRVPRWVHRQCVRLAEVDGVSLNQWILEAIGERVGAQGFLARLTERVRHSGVLAIEEEWQMTRVQRVRYLHISESEGSEGATNAMLQPPGSDYSKVTSQVAEKKESYNA